MLLAAPRARAALSVSSAGRRVTVRRRRGPAPRCSERGSGSRCACRRRTAEVATSRSGRARSCVSRPPSAISSPFWSTSLNEPRTSSGPSRYGVITVSASAISRSVPSHTAAADNHHLLELLARAQLAARLELGAARAQDRAERPACASATSRGVRLPPERRRRVASRRRPRSARPAACRPASDAPPRPRRCGRGSPARRRPRPSHAPHRGPAAAVPAHRAGWPGSGRSAAPRDGVEQVAAQRVAPARR